MGKAPRSRPWEVMVLWAEAPRPGLTQHEVECSDEVGLAGIVFSHQDHGPVLRHTSDIEPPMDLKSRTFIPIKRPITYSRPEVHRAPGSSPGESRQSSLQPLQRLPCESVLPHTARRLEHKRDYEFWAAKRPRSFGRRSRRRRSSREPTAKAGMDGAAAARQHQVVVARWAIDGSPGGGSRGPAHASPPSAALAITS